MRTVSVIGLGSMGSALARTLLAQGYEVTVWNRTAARAAPLVQAGARHAVSAREAVEASDVTLICILSHRETRALLRGVAPALAGRVIVELSTGDSQDAAALFHWLEARSVPCLIGMIAVFPGDIGKAESAIVAVGAAAAWESCGEILQALGGRSSYLGEDIAALPALFAGLFLPRQAFMFGMIYGAVLCEKAGIAAEDYVAQIPLTLKVVQDYYDIFAATVPPRAFDDPPASIGTYAAAFRDVVDTFAANGARRELPVLLKRLMDEGVEAGLAEKHLTALTDLLGK